MMTKILRLFCFIYVLGFAVWVSAQSARLTVSGTPNPSTGGTITASSSASSATCSGNTCQIDPGSSVTLSITKNNNFRFAGWSGGTGCTGTATKSLTITPTSSVSCTANLVRQVTVDGIARPSTGGTVNASSSSAGATCTGHTCVMDIGGTVTLSFNINSGYRFTQWDGSSQSCLSTANALTITSSTDISCVANSVQRFIVAGTVSAAPAGTTVKATSPSIAPQANCSGPSCTVDLNVNVTLTAPDVRGFHVTGWSGTGCKEPIDDGNPNTLALGKIFANLTCTAFYSRL